MRGVYVPLCMAGSELLKGESEGLLQLPTDKALVTDPSFRKYVEAYAAVSASIPCLGLGGHAGGRRIRIRMSVGLTWHVGGPCLVVAGPGPVLQRVCGVAQEAV